MSAADEMHVVGDLQLERKQSNILTQIFIVFFVQLLRAEGLPLADSPVMQLLLKKYQTFGEVCKIDLQQVI